MQKSLTTNIIIATIAAVAIVWFYPHPETSRYNYEEGRPWNYAQLIAPFDIPVHPDSLTLQRARDTLDAHFVPIYELNQLKTDSIVRSLPASPGNNYASRVGAALRRLYAEGVVDSETREQIAEGKLPKVRILEKNILSEMSTSQFLSPREIYTALDSQFKKDPELHHYFSSINLPEILEPNFTLNETESKRHYEYDYLTLTADRGLILQGQSIIDKGAIVTPQDFTNLRTYETMLAERNTSSGTNDLLLLLGQFLYVSLLLASLLSYFYFFVPKIFKSRQAMIFMLLLPVLFFLLATGLNSFVQGGIYIAPLMIVPLMTLVFFDGRSAIMTSFVCTMICAGITTFALEFIFLQFCATGAAVYSLRELSRRAQLLRTSLTVVVAYIGAYVSLELLMNGAVDGISIRMIVFLAINAALTSMSYILMFAVERIFGFVSTVTLVELADINTPLLMKLSDECPGTFQHSIAVSNLASDAAQRIGANVQLIRAGALYHDIGKLSNPAFFTENQHGVNPHDALPPERSASIIVKHVTDGLKLAEKEGLPGMIRDFIREHHGAGMAKYFYYNACKAAPEGTSVDPAPYTYPGPNPRSVETSLLMMADSVEAASRSLSDHSPEAISALVNKIIDGQIADGLHNQSPIAFRDIDIIKKAFVKRLMTIYHSRVAYPGAPKPAGTPASDGSKAQ
ncbi:MAG: HDIG domain-containing protein [Muribaculaceae bacterium]|nr:HDIG domain-containing protein [Muribaculaceae bacterium]